MVQETVQHDVEVLAPVDGPAPPKARGPRTQFWHWQLGNGRVTVAALIPPRGHGLRRIPFGVSFASPFDCSKGFRRDLGRRIAAGRAGRAAAMLATGEADRSGPVDWGERVDPATKTKRLWPLFRGRLDEAARIGEIPDLALSLLFWHRQVPSWARRPMRTRSLSS